MPGLEVVGQVLDLGQEVAGSLGIGELFGAGSYVHQPSPSELAKRINGSPKKVKTKTKTDPGKHVLKFDDAIKCVEDTLNDDKLFLQAFLKGLKSVLTSAAGVPDDSMMQQLAQAIVDCMEKKLLRQNKPERSVDGPHRTRK